MIVIVYFLEHRQNQLIILVKVEFIFYVYISIYLQAPVMHKIRSLLFKCIISHYCIISVLSALGKLQKSSPNTFIPVHNVNHMQLRSHKQHCQTTIWNLPEEVILLIFQGLHIKDILNLRKVCNSRRFWMYPIS